MKDWRSVPVDELRAWARDEAECTSLRALAARVGIGRTTLQHFIDSDTHTHPRIRRKIALACMGASTVDGALDVLVAPLPPEVQPDARAALLGLVDELYQAHGVVR